MNKECSIKKTSRKRVSGTNGPRRHQLKSFDTVDSSVPDTVLNEILEIANTYTENDLGGDNYQISQQCNVKEVFTSSDTYRQILLQQCIDPNADTIDETNYVSWRDDIPTNNIRSYLEETFKRPFRARISVMPAGQDLNWHIDTDTSVLCRVQVAAHSSGSEFQFKTKQGHDTLIMSPGNAYFVNTGWTHRVVNTTNDIRIVLIVGVLFDDIPNNEDLRL